MSAIYFDSSGGNPPIYLGSPTTSENAAAITGNQSESFFGTTSNNSVITSILDITLTHYYRILLLSDKTLLIISE